MGRIGKALHKFWSYLIVGKGIRETFKKVWTGFWKEIDRILGVIAREILKRKTKIIPNKVFFYTQEFRYGCNPKYICEEVLRQGLDIDIVWRVGPKSRGGVPQYVRGVKPGTFGFYKEIFSSNIIVANSYIFLDQTLFLKRKQTLIQTWHGSLGIKRFGKHDMKDSWRRIWASVITGKMSDYCITNSSFVSGSLRNTYWPKTPMMEFGHPRNDLFFDNHKEKREVLRKQLCKKWRVDSETKFVMYGPTFRDSKNFDCYDIEFARLVSALERRFGGKWCVLLRYHPSLAKEYKKKGYNGKNGTVNIINVTDYLDMQELIAVTDIAITDYSSWIYDFMLLRRPGFIFATDISLYNTERGFCYPLETTPFPIAVDNNELEANILNFDEGAYSARLEKFLIDKGCVEDGHASERVVELIKSIVGSDGQDKKKEAIERLSNSLAQHPYVAHALGGINGKDCLNVIDTLDYYYSKGCRVFEADLRFTADEQLVLANGDWRKIDYNRLGVEFIPDPLSESVDPVCLVPKYKDFKNWRIQNEYTAADLEDLLNAMKRYDDIYIVLDLGGVRDYEYTSKVYRKIVTQAKHNISLLDRIIATARSTEMLKAIKDNYEFPFLALFFDVEDECRKDEFDSAGSFIKYCETQGVKVCLLDDKDYTEENAREIAKSSLLSIVYTINNRERCEAVLSMGARAVGTDYLCVGV